MVELARIAARIGNMVIDLKQVKLAIFTRNTDSKTVDTVAIY